jgi:hypothetical protein
MKFTALEKQKFIDEVVGSEGKKVILVCEEHLWAAGGQTPPTSGCRECWMAFYLSILAKCPPHLRDQRLSELETGIRHATEEVERGKFDFVPFRHPQMKIEKN